MVRGFYFCLLLCLAVSARAQPLFSGGLQHRLAPAVASIDITFAGSSSPEARYDYAGTAFGLTYSIQGARFTVLYGRQDPFQNMLSFALSTWRNLPFADLTSGQTSFGVPLGLMVTTFRISQGGSGLEPYRATSVRLGVGGGLRQVISRRTVLHARVSPYAGITTSPMVDLVGFSMAAEADARLDVAEIFRSVGLLLGYTFRYQFWNLNGSGPFSEAVDENLDYRGLEHVFRAGVSF